MRGKLSRNVVVKVDERLRDNNYHDIKLNFEVEKIQFCVIF